MPTNPTPIEAARTSGVVWRARGKGSTLGELYAAIPTSLHLPMLIARCGAAARTNLALTGTRIRSYDCVRVLSLTVERAGTR